MEKDDTNSYDALIARTDLKILSSDISDDFIGVFDTNFFDRCLERGGLFEYFVQTFTHNAKSEHANNQCFF